MELDLARCEYSELRDSVIRIAAELPTSDPTGATPASGKTLETMQPLGLIARPRDPEVLADGSTGDGANALYLFHGGEGFIMPLLDPRFVSAVPPVKKGGTALYCAPGAILNFDGDDGTCLLLVPATNGKSHVLVIDNPNDAIQLRHASGSGIAMLGSGTKPVVLNNSAGNVCIMLDDNGVTISGNTQCVGSMVIGQVPSALPVALYDAWAAWAAIATSMIKTISIAYPSGATVLEAALDAALAALDVAGKSTVLRASPGPT